MIVACDDLLRRSEHAPIRAEILFWKGNAHDQAGAAWQGEAISCFREGISIAGMQWTIKAKLIASLGKIYSTTGDCASYDKILQEFNRIAGDRQPAVMWSGAYVWFNFGVTLDNAFRYQEAATAYEIGHALAVEFEVSDLVGPCLHNLGGVHLAVGQLPKALYCMEKAEEVLDNEEVGHKILSRRAEYFLSAGDLVSTQQLITSALTHPRIDDMTRSDVFYTWALGLQKLGRLSEAHAKGLLALDYAVQAVHYPGLHKINRFLQGLMPLPVRA